jgi:2-oxoglutarate dehydrogenase E1 component
MTGLEEVVWCQEEPRNNGAWFFVDSRIEKALVDAGHVGMRPTYAGRDAAASPATGLASRHKEQQEALVADALGLAKHK